MTNTTVLDLEEFLDVAYKSLHLTLVEFVVFEDLPYVYPGGLKRWDALVLLDGMGSRVVRRQPQGDIAVKKPDHFVLD